MPKTPETFTYDFDGNLLTNGRWTHSWDGENRLTSVTALASIPATAKSKVDYTYDAQGRMIQRKVSDWNGTNYTLTSTSKFVYEGEGWNIVAELNATNALVRSYVWGNDLSGSAQGAGGVGGLLMIRDAATGSSHHVCYDGNGNIVALVNAATKEVSAEYEYDPFGNCIKASGPMAKVNPFRFSTKYVDDRTGNLYYGYRWYNSGIGRWLSRDPIEEAGGLNLYGFVGNKGIHSFDPFGLLDTPTSTITPWELGWEWLTGDNPEHREFKDGDHFAELLRLLENMRKLIKKAAEEAARRCANGCNNKDFQISGEQGKYDLGGVQGVGKYFKDYSTLLTGRLTGNLAVTFLGSYDATLTTTGISCCAGKAHVKLDINNSSTAASALRPPVFGYTEWWQKNVAPLINKLFQNGGGSPTTQHIKLNEDVTFKKSNCPN